MEGQSLLVGFDVVNVIDFTQHSQLGFFLLKELRNNSDCAETPIRLDGTDVRHEFSVISVIIDPVTLEIHEETFVGCNSSHHPLRFGIV